MTFGLAMMLLFLLPTTLCQSSFRPWRGLVPLKSTCEDVKRFLKVEKCEFPFSEFKLQDTRVVVYFSSCRCCGQWRVKRGVVTSIAIYPLIGQRVSELNLGSGFVRVPDEEITGGTRFINKSEGVTIYSVGNTINEILIYPTSRDQRLRCLKRRSTKSVHSTEQHRS